MDLDIILIYTCYMFSGLGFSLGYIYYLSILSAIYYKYILYISKQFCLCLKSYVHSIFHQTLIIAVQHYLSKS